MSVSTYLREIGRGRHHAKSLTQAQAEDLMGQILDGQVSDLQLGAFCAAMRVKGETAQELAGFVQATQARLQRLPAQAPTVVIPSYNGARRLPLLTPLLAGLLARQGFSVVIHGMSTEARRVACDAVITALGWPVLNTCREVAAGEVVFVPTSVLCQGLQRLLQVREVIGLRNSGHSVAKMINPMQQGGLLISSYTHPEYSQPMAEALALTQTNALLLRGTEGEAVADARRQPLIEAVLQRGRFQLAEAQTGPLMHVPDLPQDIDAVSTASFIRRILAGEVPVPTPIQTQVNCLRQVMAQLASA